MRKNGNKTNYHYFIEFFDDNQKFVERKYYMTSQQIVEQFNCCRKALFNHINNPNKRSKKLGKTIITRICEPVQITMPNPQLL